MGERMYKSTFHWPKHKSRILGPIHPLLLPVGIYKNRAFQKELYIFESWYAFIQRLCTVFWTVIMLQSTRTPCIYFAGSCARILQILSPSLLVVVITSFWRRIRLHNKLEIPFCLISSTLCHADVWRNEGMAPSFLTSALDGGECSASLPCRFTLGKSPLCPLDGMPGGHLSRSGCCGEEKKYCTIRNGTQAFHSAGRHYIDWGIQLHAVNDSLTCRYRTVTNDKSLFISIILAWRPVHCQPVIMVTFVSVHLKIPSGFSWFSLSEWLVSVLIVW
jgi:hypothetical protein